MTDIQVEALEAIKSRGHILAEGDRVTVPEDVARHWCEHGWAQAVNGEIETKERVVVRSVVTPHSAVHAQKAENVRG